MSCKLSVNSYKMRFIKGSEDYQYRRHSLKRAKERHPQLARRFHSKFLAVCDKWMANHVTSDLTKACEEWMMGNVPGLRPCTTLREVDREQPLERVRYRVKWEEKEKEKAPTEMKSGDKDDEPSAAEEKTTITETETDENMETS